MTNGPDAEIVDLGLAPPPPPPPVRHSIVYRASVTIMAISALIGVMSVMTFVSVGWPSRLRGYVVGVFVTSITLFLASASSAVFAAARETYARRDDSREP